MGRLRKLTGLIIVLGAGVAVARRWSMQRDAATDGWLTPDIPESGPQPSFTRLSPLSGNSTGAASVGPTATEAAPTTTATVPTYSEHFAHVQAHDDQADDAVVRGIVRYCGIALRNPGSVRVTAGNATEIARVRDNFLRKKLGVTASDEDLESAIADVMGQMNDGPDHARVTLYYLLAKRYEKFPVFS